MENFPRKETKKEAVCMDEQSWKAKQKTIELEILKTSSVQKKEVLDDGLEAEILSKSFMTPGYQLKEIYGKNKLIQNETVYRNLALNISTPRDILIELSGEYGDMVLQNPVSEITMEHLEDWSWYYAMSPKLLETVPLPKSFEQQCKIADYYKKNDLNLNLVALCCNPTSDHKIILNIIENFHYLTRYELIQNPKIQPEIATHLFKKYFLSNDLLQLSYIACNPALNQEFLLQFLQIKELGLLLDPKKIRIIFCSNKTSSKVRQYLASMSTFRFSDDLIINKNEMLQYLKSTSGIAEVAASEDVLACCIDSNTDPLKALSLVKTLDYNQQVILIEQSQLRPELVRYYFEKFLLANDISNLKNLLQYHILNQTYLLSLLQRNELRLLINKEIVTLLVSSPHSSPDVLDFIYDNFHIDSIHKELASHLNLSTKTLEKLSRSKILYCHYAIATHPHITPDILAKLAESENEYARSLVAENPQTEVETLIQLSDDPNELVRSKIAQNPNTPPQTLAFLVNEKSKLVLESLAKNKNLNSQTAQNL
jgi:hypothetical protein